MRRFGEAERCAWENIFSFAYELALFDRVFLQHDTGEAIVSRPMIPKHVQEILAAIVVVKQRWIEAAAVEVNGIRPIAINARAGDEIVVKITHRRATRSRDAATAEALHVGVNEPEQSIRVAQAWRPDPAGIGIAEHVQLAGAIERP